ncbi:hypothetical protein ACKLNR_012932 [Fusarium oxysporum f. sp. zingiberi]
MSASKQPKSRFKCLNYYLGDPIPCNSVTCAAYSKDKKSVDPPNDDFVISATTPDDRAIYWAFRNAKPLKTMIEVQSMTNSSIKSVITKRQDKEGIKQVVDQLNRQALVKAIKRLLKEGVFQDPSKAKLRFPHLFPDTTVEEKLEDPPSQGNVDRDTSSEQAPGRTKIDWGEQFSIGRCPRGENEDEVNKEDSTSVARMTKSHAAEEESHHAGPEDEEAITSTELTQTEERVNWPGLHGSGSQQSDRCSSDDQEALQLPFKSQHMLVGYLQQYLEGICYEFGKKNMLEALDKHGWDCAEAAQLESWMEEFIRRAIYFKDVIDEEAAVGLFRSVADIQHVAICRVRIDLAGIKKFLLDTVRLTQILRVGDSHMVMDLFRTDIKRTLDNLREDKDFLKSQLRVRLCQFRHQREVIDAQEKLALSEIDKDIGECQAKAGTQVRKRTRKAGKGLVVESSDGE